MKFYNVETSKLCWIYLRKCLVPLNNVEMTTLLHRANLSWLPCDDEALHPAPLPPPPTYYGSLILSISLLPMITMRFMQHLGLFRRSKAPYKHMFKLRMLPFMTLFNSGMMSFMGWLPCKTNIFRTLGQSWDLRDIDISLKAKPPPSFSSSLMMLLGTPHSLSYLYASIVDNALPKHRGVELNDSVWCLISWVCGCVYSVHDCILSCMLGLTSCS